MYSSHEFLLNFVGFVGEGDVIVFVLDYGLCEVEGGVDKWGVYRLLWLHY